VQINTLDSQFFILLSRSHRFILLI